MLTLVRHPSWGTITDFPGFITFAKIDAFTLENCSTDIKRNHIIVAGLIFIILVTFFSYVKYHRYTQGLSMVISSDAAGYHQYLTALFIKKDIMNQPYGFPLESGGLFNKYTYGVALLELPFFLVAHAVALVFNLPATGKFTPYVFGVNVAGAFYTFTGLLLLFKLFRRKYGNRVAWISTGTLFLGTNLLFYAYLEPGASHVYAFFLVSCVVYLVPSFYRNPGWKTAMLMALAIGILCLIRIPHIIVLLYLILYHANSLAKARDNIRFLWGQIRYLWVIPVFVVLLYSPQILYWYSLTDKFVINPYQYSYVEEGFFNLFHPKIGLVLFGSTGGWLVLTPLMLFALAGIIFQIKTKTGSPWPVLAITIIVTYLYGSWWHPSIAGSYGHRGFVDIYALLALPFAYVVNLAITSGNKKIFTVFAGILTLFVYINMRMSFMYNYWWWDVEWGWSSYFKTLLRVFFIDIGGG